MADPFPFLTNFNNSIGRLNGLTTTAERDSARLNTERQNFTRDARARLATMSQAVADLNGRVTAFVAELARLRQQVADNDAIVARNLAIIDRLNGELDALRGQSSSLAPGAAPVIRDGYADVKGLQEQVRQLTAENNALKEVRTRLINGIVAANPILARIEAVFAQINANPIPTAELLAEMDRLNREIEAILALLPGPGAGAKPGAKPGPPPGSGSGGFFDSLFGSGASSSPLALGGNPLISTPSQGVQASLQPQVGTAYSGPVNSAGRPNPIMGNTPSSFFTDDLNNQLRQKPPASSYLGFGGKWKKSKKQKGGYIYNPSTKHTFKSPKRTTRTTTGRTTRSTGRSTKRSTSRRRTKRVKI